jgi:PAS domain S-box-containing protein
VLPPGHPAPGYHFGPYSIIVLATVAIALAVANRAWRHRSAPGAIYLFFLALAAAEWALAGAFEVAATDLPVKVLWAQIGYVGTMATAPAFLLFTLDYSHQSPRVTLRAVLLVSIVPVLTWLAAVTNGLHGWLWSDIRFDQANNIAVYTHGPWFWVSFVYLYALLVWGSVVLLLAVIRFHRHFRSRLIVLLVGALLPIVANVLYVSGALPPRGLDWTPVGLALSGLFLAWGVYRQRLFDLMPVARGWLFENMADGVVVVDDENRIVDANPGAHRMLDATGQMLVGRLVRDVTKAWSGSLPLDSAERASSEVILGHDDLRIVDVQVSPLYARSGKTTGRLIVMRDVTERRRAEEALRDMNVTLEELVAGRTAEIEAERVKSDAILRSVGDAIALVSPELAIMYSNQAFAALTGYAANEALGRSLRALEAWPASGQVRQEIAATLAQGGMWRGDFAGRHKDGRRYDAALTVSAASSTYSRVSGYVASYLDISERRRLEDARDHFIGNVSHSFRTPLSAIKLCAYILQRSKDPQMAAQYLENLVRQTAQLEQLVQDVVTMSKIDVARREDNRELVSLGGIAEQLVERYQQQARDAGLLLQAAGIPAGLPPVEGDAQLLTQAVEQLLKNALIYTPSGGQISLTAGTAEQGGRAWVVVGVQDSGPGIQADEQSRVFERFYRGSMAQTGHILGTGLGLSIVERVARTYGGRATVESAPGQGSLFRLWMPVGGA